MSQPRYPLTDLVNIRDLREQEAAQQVSAARQRLEDAKAAVIQANEDWVSYHEWRIEEEKRSFARILEKEVSLQRLEEQKQEVHALRDKETEYREKILEAERQVVESESFLQEKLQEHRQAQHDLQKLHEHRELWEAELVQVLSKKEEDEMDDFRSTPQPAFGSPEPA